jgi:hypothetical protein
MGTTRRRIDPSFSTFPRLGCRLFQGLRGFRRGLLVEEIVADDRHTERERNCSRWLYRVFDPTTKTCSGENDDVSCDVTAVCLFISKGNFLEGAEEYFY